VQVQLRLGELTDEGVGRADGYGSHLFDCRFLGKVLRGKGDLLAADS
jgi:hypothetical protein